MIFSWCPNLVLDGVDKCDTTDGLRILKKRRVAMATADNAAGPL